jgi:hypothetical protein
MGKLRNFVWLRWTLLLEYPKQFLLIPLWLLVAGLVLFGLGLTFDNPFAIIVLVYSGYAMWLMSVISFVVGVLVLRPDQDGK